MTRQVSWITIYTIVVCTKVFIFHRKSHVGVTKSLLRRFKFHFSKLKHLSIFSGYLLISKLWLVITQEVVPHNVSNTLKSDINVRGGGEFSLLFLSLFLSLTRIHLFPTCNTQYISGALRINLASKLGYDDD